MLGAAGHQGAVRKTVGASAGTGTCRRMLAKGVRLKRSDDLFRASGGLDKNHRYSARLERFDGARSDSAAQYGLTIPQHLDKPGVTVMCRRHHRSARFRVHDNLR